MSFPEPRFSKNQTVYYAGTKMKTKQHPCPDCLDTKLWEAKSPAGHTYTMDCPRCTSGYKHYRGVSLNYQWFEPLVEQLTIGSIRVDTGDDDPVQYMCKETGVGTGRVYREKDLFALKAEAARWAQMKCGELNQTNPLVTETFNSSLSVSDYELHDAVLNEAKALRLSYEGKYGWFYRDLRDCVSVEEFKDVLRRFESKEDD